VYGRVCTAFARIVRRAVIERVSYPLRVWLARPETRGNIRDAESVACTFARPPQRASRWDSADTRATGVCTCAGCMKVMPSATTSSTAICTKATSTAIWCGTCTHGVRRISCRSTPVVTPPRRAIPIHPALSH
jgi:hypothetical protein